MLTKLIFLFIGFVLGSFFMLVIMCCLQMSKKEELVDRRESN